MVLDKSPPTDIHQPISLPSPSLRSIHLPRHHPHPPSPFLPSSDQSPQNLRHRPIKPPQGYPQHTPAPKTPANTGKRGSQYACLGGWRFSPLSPGTGPSHFLFLVPISRVFAPEEWWVWYC
ncbi:hypothetical protein P153DRAFT_380836 [Dothidotthia symphoricarpi CBS 119687]|uniref:Uncharacterized protein n=1 Tax=Dothidotthia symphoricarpi CBS 119687 TaxID=1392245 RepID=A0A6A6ATX0_9PLEO|nr:uncharacterized protein P153DRAFT_380836 [Dothidotthia symphoricarpi CBS 119687]KAF2135036.1 hypothetical protein P153DRAFT_380836 [Dothidotthia symphoricarpi CBS 119687]